jgi:type IV pilus assembly protein PilM
MQKILGLDIGTYSIKALIIWNNYKNLKIFKFIEKKIEYDTKMSLQIAQQKTLANLLTEEQFDYDLAYGALDSRFVSIHKVDFKNIKKRDLPGFLRNELESSSPFAIEDSIFDYQIINSDKKSSSALAILCEKERIKQLLETFEQGQIKVKIIDIEHLTYLNIISYLIPDPHTQLASAVSKSKNITKNCFLILNIGHTKTTLTFLDHKNILYTRVIRIAGNYFTEILQEKFNLSLKEAEEIKKIVTLNPDSFQKDFKEKEEAISFILSQALLEIGIEILRTIHSLEEKEKIKVHSIYLCGGSSKIKGIENYLEKIFSIPVSFFSLRKENLDSKKLKDFEKPDPHFDLPLYAQCLSSTLRGVPDRDVRSKINFRQGEFAQINNYEKIITQIYLYAITIFVILCFLFVSYIVRFYFFKKEYNILKNDFRKNTISLFSGEPYALKIISSKKSMNFEDYSKKSLSLIKENLKNRKKILYKYEKSQNSFPLKILNDISKLIPKEIYFEVSEFNLKKDYLYIEAETDQKSNILKIVQKISKSKFLYNIKENTVDQKELNENALHYFSLSAAFSEEEGD